MDNHTYEQTFNVKYQEQQNKFSLKVFGLILPAILVFVVCGTFFFYKDAPFCMIAMPACIALPSLWLFIISIRHRHWLAGCYRLTSCGIMLRERRRKETTIPWSSVVAVDTGILRGYENRAVPIIRCFLSISTWEKFTPNLQRQAEEPTIRNYYRFRKECFVLEYTQERQQAIQEFWCRVCDKERDKPIVDSEKRMEPDNNFQYAFTKDISNYGPSMLRIHLVIVCIVLIAIPIIWLSNPTDPDNLIGALGLVFLCLFGLAMLNIERPAMKWLRSEYRLSRDGIYIKHKKRVTEFTPWTSIIGVERRLMSVARRENISVICLCRSPAGEFRLDAYSKQNKQSQKYQEYYNLREDIITIGYTKERMTKIRALQRDAFHK